MEIKKYGEKTFVVFTAEEIAVRKRFEAAMTSAETTEKVMDGLLQAMVRVEAERRSAWAELTESIADSLGIDTEDAPTSMEYSWFKQGVQISEEVLALSRVTKKMNIDLGK